LFEEMWADAGWGRGWVENLAVEAEGYLAPSRNAEGMIEDFGALVKFEIFIGRVFSVRSN
jgi:hypothetical protein